MSQRTPQKQRAVENPLSRHGKSQNSLKSQDNGSARSKSPINPTKETLNEKPGSRGSSTRGTKTTYESLLEGRSMSRSKLSDDKSSPIPNQKYQKSQRSPGLSKVPSAGKLDSPACTSKQNSKRSTTSVEKKSCLKYLPTSATKDQAVAESQTLLKESENLLSKYRHSNQDEDLTASPPQKRYPSVQDLENFKLKDLGRERELARSRDRENERTSVQGTRKGESIYERVKREYAGVSLKYEYPPDDALERKEPSRERYPISSEHSRDKYQISSVTPTRDNLGHFSRFSGNDYSQKGSEGRLASEPAEDIYQRRPPRSPNNPAKQQNVQFADKKLSEPYSKGFDSELVSQRSQSTYRLGEDRNDLDNLRDRQDNPLHQQQPKSRRYAETFQKNESELYSASEFKPHAPNGRVLSGTNRQGVGNYHDSYPRRRSYERRFPELLSEKPEQPGEKTNQGVVGGMERKLSENRKLRSYENLDRRPLTSNPTKFKYDLIKPIPLDPEYEKKQQDIHKKQENYRFEDEYSSTSGYVRGKEFTSNDQRGFKDQYNSDHFSKNDAEKIIQISRIDDSNLDPRELHRDDPLLNYESRAREIDSHLPANYVESIKASGYTQKEKEAIKVVCRDYNPSESNMNQTRYAAATRNGQELFTTYPTYIPDIGKDIGPSKTNNLETGKANSAINDEQRLAIRRGSENRSVYPRDIADYNSGSKSTIIQAQETIMKQEPYRAKEVNPGKTSYIDVGFDKTYYDNVKKEIEESRRIAQKYLKRDYEADPHIHPSKEKPEDARKLSRETIRNSRDFGEMPIARPPSRDVRKETEFEIRPTQEIPISIKHTQSIYQAPRDIMIREIPSRELQARELCLRDYGSREQINKEEPSKILLRDIPSKEWKREFTTPTISNNNEVLRREWVNRDHEQREINIASHYTPFAKKMSTGGEPRGPIFAKPMEIVRTEESPRERFEREPHSNKIRDFKKSPSSDVVTVKNVISDISPNKDKFLELAEKYKVLNEKYKNFSEKSENSEAISNMNRGVVDKDRNLGLAKENENGNKNRNDQRTFVERTLQKQNEKGLLKNHPESNSIFKGTLDSRNRPSVGNENLIGERISIKGSENPISSEYPYNVKRVQFETQEYNSKGREDSKNPLQEKKANERPISYNRDDSTSELIKYTSEKYKNIKNVEIMQVKTMCQNDNRNYITTDSSKKDMPANVIPKYNEFIQRGNQPIIQGENRYYQF